MNLCANNHDKKVVGTRPSGQCAECARQANREHHRRKRGSTPKARSEPRGVFVPRLGAARSALGLSQTELAFRVGCHRTTICHAESGRTKLSRKLVTEIMALIVAKGGRSA